MTEMTAEELAAGLPGKHRPSVATGDGDRYLYIFGGEPGAKGTHPRHVAIMTDGDSGELCVALSTYGVGAEHFDVLDAESARRRMKQFILGKEKTEEFDAEQTTRAPNCADCGVVLYHGPDLGGGWSDAAYSCDGEDCSKIICYSCLERGKGYCQAVGCQAESAEVEQWIIDTLGPRGSVAPKKAGEP